MKRKARLVKENNESREYSDTRGQAFLFIETDCEDTWKLIHSSESMKKFRCYAFPDQGQFESRGDYYEFRMEYDVPSYKEKMFRAAYKTAKKEVCKKDR